MWKNIFPSLFPHALVGVYREPSNNSQPASRNFTFTAFLVFHKKTVEYREMIPVDPLNSGSEDVYCDTDSTMRLPDNVPRIRTFSSAMI